MDKEFKSYFKEGQKPKKEKKPLKRTRIKYKPKKTGQTEIFEEIAAEREWKCFVTGEPLRELTATQFSHVLPKALNKYPLYKLNKDNIVLLCNWVHHAWDFMPRSELKKNKLFDKLFKLEAELKEKYKQL